jgi:hypothetical protein
VTVAFVVHDGAPIEFLQFDRSGHPQREEKE